MASVSLLIPPLPNTERGYPTRLDCSSDGTKLVYPSGRFIVIRKIDDPFDCRIYGGHSERTTAVAYGPSYGCIASGDITGKVRIWGLNEDFSLLYEGQQLSGVIRDIRFSGDTEYLTVVGEGKETFGACINRSGNRVGDIATGHTMNILTADFRPRRPFRVGSAGESSHIGWYCGPPFRNDHLIKEHSKYVNTVRFSPDGMLFASASSDKKICLFTGDTGELKFCFAEEDAHSSSVYSVSWSPDGSQLLSASADKTCKLWDVETGRAISTFRFSENPSVLDMQVGCLWTPKQMISVNLSGQIFYLDPSNPNRPLLTIEGHQSSVTASACDQVTGTIYTGDLDGVVCSCSREREVRRIGGHRLSETKINSISSSVSMETIFVADSSSSFTLLDRNSGDVVANESLRKSAIASCSSEDGVVFAITNEELTAVQSSSEFASMKLSVSQRTISCTPSGDNVAIGDDNGVVHIISFDRSNGSFSVKNKIELTSNKITALAISPDGSRFAMGTSGRELHLVSLDSQKSLHGNLAYHNSLVSGFAWTPDGSRFVSSSNDGTLLLWSDLDSKMSRVKIPVVHNGFVSSCAFLDDITLVSTGLDGVVVTYTLQ